MLKSKFLRKIVVMLVCAFMMVSLCACGASKGNSSGNTNPPSPDNLVIEVFGGGYGTEWLYAIAREFERNTGNKVSITVQMGEQGISNMSTSFQSGVSETDIYFTKGSVFNGVYSGKTRVNGVNYDCAYADLTDVYNAEIEGSDMTYKEKMDASYEEFYNCDGKYYCTSWTAGIMGMIVNVDVWNRAGLTSFPRTTDEMFEMADSLKSQNIVPFIYSAPAEYWTSIAPVFFAQYEGSERMEQIYQGYDSNGDRYTDRIADFEGYYETLVLYDRLLKKENNYMHPASRDADFTNMQGMFLQGMAALSPNGDWLEKEMQQNYQNANIRYLKMPVISALSKRCSFKNASDADAKLRELIDYVDSHASGYDGKPSWATDNDVDIVRDSRSLELSAGAEHIAYIPCYSNQVEMAKQFLIYMATDEAMSIYRNATGGSDLPFKWATEPTERNYSTFRNSILDVSARTKFFIPSTKDRFFALGGLNFYFALDVSGNRYVYKFSAINAKSYMSPMAYYLAEQEFFQKNISTIKKSAGV